MSETRILLVKTSSLGDVVHLLPALTEAAAQRPDVRFDWLVEEAFAEIPAWHPAVSRVIPVAFRAGRRAPLQFWRDGYWQAFTERLRQHQYDLIIDAQGLLKSALLASRAIGRRAGPDMGSAREPLAALSYGRRLPVPRGVHAVERLRHLLAGAFGYEVGSEPPDYGLDARVSDLQREHGAQRDEVLLLHGTTWLDKHWPEPHWRELARRLRADGLRAVLPWGNDAERARAERIAQAADGEVLNKGPLATLFERMALARAVVGVDSGLLHMAAAAGVPGIGLYGPTDPARTGTWGGRIRDLQANLSCIPCLSRRCLSVEPVRVDQATGTALEPPCLGALLPAGVGQALHAVLDSARQTAQQTLVVKGALQKGAQQRGARQRGARQRGAQQNATPQEAARWPQQIAVQAIDPAPHEAGQSEQQSRRQALQQPSPDQRPPEHQPPHRSAGHVPGSSGSP